MLTRHLQPILISLCLVILFSLGASLDAAETSTPEPPPAPLTTADPAIPVDELALLVQPLTTDELFVEADAWLEILKAKVTELSQAEIAVKRKNRVIKQAEEVKDSIGEAKEALKDVEDITTAAQAARTPQAVEEVTDAAKEAQKAVEKVADTVEKITEETQQEGPEQAQKESATATIPQERDTKLDAALDTAAKGAQDAREGARAVTETIQETAQRVEQGETESHAGKRRETEAAVAQTKEALDTVDRAVKEVVEDVRQEGGRGVTGQSKLEQVEAVADAVAESKAEEKSEILDITTALREERIGLIDRLNVILNALNDKLGKTAEGTDHEKVVPYRLYAQSVGGIKVDISDTQAAYSTILGWLQSEQGGIRWAKNLGAFLATVVAFWLLGLLLSKIGERALRLTQRTSVLLRVFVVGAIRRSVLIIGIIVGLSALEVNIGPLLAVVGAAGFVVAFALQSTLSNFASGLMIMCYKPFDVGHVINVAGLVGVVKSMNLVNTTIATFDNQIMIVPNNAIWGSTITNITGSDERRVDLVFGISYSDDINRAQQILEEIVRDHPLVLAAPEPLIRLDALGESSVNFICRPWVKTSDWGQVRWDIIRAAKERFDQAGISIPFPQRDVHVYHTVAAARDPTDRPTEHTVSLQAPSGARVAANP